MRRLTTPIKDNKPIYSFEDFTGTTQITESPLQLTHEEKITRITSGKKYQQLTNENEHELQEYNKSTNFHGHFENRLRYSQV